jgi:hypothetical protein
MQRNRRAQMTIYSDVRVVLLHVSQPDSRRRTNAQIDGDLTAQKQERVGQSANEVSSYSSLSPIWRPQAVNRQDLSSLSPL